jgi:hypothetical protein
MTDEEISESYTEKRRLDTIKGTVVSDKKDTDDFTSKDAAYEKRFNAKMELFKGEFAVDMNDSNDAMLLVLLVKHSLQLEDLDRKIQREMSGDDSRNLKNLGDVQRSLVTSINELQKNLGISRQTRKEEQSDDIPKWISETRRKALDYWQRKTIPVSCEQCHIELARLWLNFAELPHKVEIELECQHCGEKVVFLQ